MYNIRLLAVCCLLFVFGCSNTNQESSIVKIKGSESLHEVFSALKKDFEAIQDTVKIVLEGGGSKTGLMGIKDEQIDIGLSSYGFDLDSVLGDGHTVNEQIIAYDGIVLINNVNNPVNKLSDAQITGIYNGAITDWSQLGGEPGRILPIIRNENSGTQKFFSEFFNLNDFSTEAVMAEENHEIIDKVLKDRSGIGFIGFSYVSLNVQDLNLSTVTRDDTFYVAPSFKSIRKGDYPLKRALRIYYNNQFDNKTKSFLTYLETDRAQKIIESNGLISNSEKLTSL